MSARPAPRLLRNQSELSTAVASVFLAGGLFAMLTATIFPPQKTWSWPNPHMVSVTTTAVAVLVFIRGRRLSRITAGIATGGFVVLLILATARVSSLERAIAAGLLIVGVILIFAWFMPPVVARLVGYTSLAGYGTALLLQYPGSGTAIIVLAISALSVLLTEVFGSFKRELQRTTLTDHLCQVWNRAGFELMLQKEIRSLARTKAPLSVLFLDLDGFKGVNDRSGHLAGDRVLQEMSRRLEQSVRARDSVARIGGDEFVLILPLTTADEARELGRRLRHEVDVCEWTFGVAEYRDGESAEEFITRSDAELLEHKRRRPGASRGADQIAADPGT